MMFMKWKRLSHTIETRAEVAAAAQFPTMKSFFFWAQNQTEQKANASLTSERKCFWVHVWFDSFPMINDCSVGSCCVCVFVFHNLGVKETEALIGWLLKCSVNMTRCISLFIFIKVIWSYRFRDTSPWFWEIKSYSAVGGSSLSRIWFKDWSCCGPAPESWLPSLCPWKRAFKECLLLKHRGWGVEVGLEHT